jgi:tRNA modification GTPase
VQALTAQPLAGLNIDADLRLSDVHSTLPATLHIFRAPRSYTGQDLIEIHTVSSPPLVERLIADLLNAGARAAQPGEFTQRAFLAGKLDLTRAEAVQAVVESTTDRDVHSALQQLAGNMARPLEHLREDLLNLLADIEAALDFAEEDLEFVSASDTLRRIGAGLAQLMNLERQLRDRTVSGRAVSVVLAGRPNAGKSSLFNALAGAEHAIVSPVPGTTRDWLSFTTLLGGVPVELIDTAGVHATENFLDRESQRLGHGQLTAADLVLWCVDPREAASPPPECTVLKVLTKSDLMTSSDATLAVSSVTGDGLAELREALTERVTALARSPLAPSQSRCRHHVQEGLQALRRAHEHALQSDPPELLALALRESLDAIGALVGTVFTDDLLDRIFSRFCIGK